MSVADFNRTLSMNTEFLMPFAFTLTNNKEDAKDLFQETLFRALANRDKYSIGTNLKAWLYTIMRNIFINTYRKKSRTQLVFDGTYNDFFINSTQVVTYNSATASMNIKEIYTKIVNLPDIFKDPFVLYFDGYKYNEIADMLCEPLGTIKSRIHFARKLLRAQIERF
jgi:RNA polymerase sigma factor (sigma-70 family)